MKLLLFDIDGTLLKSNGAGRRAMNQSIAPMLGLDTLNLEGIDFGGRTDPQIIRDILMANGLEQDEAEATLTEAINSFVVAYSQTFQDEYVTALDGAVELVQALAEFQHIQLALLTGNVQPTAYIKVGGIGLADYFPFGAFGSDHADRSYLPQVAVERALGYTGHTFREKDIVIIGDTKHDILCGRHLNVMSIAVSTGHYNSEDLSQYNPDYLLDDLSDTEKIIELIV